MARYFFHLRRGSDLHKDEEGVLLDSVKDVEREAWEGSRVILADDTVDGTRYEITDEQGTVVLIYPILKAFDVERPR